MASIVSAGTTSATALNMSADTTGILQLASNNGTVALTVTTAQFIGVGTASPISIFNASFSGGTVSGTHSMAFGFPYAANLQLKSTNAGTSVAVASVGLYSNPERTKEFAFYNQATDARVGYLGYQYGSGGAIVDLTLFNTLNGALILSTNNAERARIDPAGSLLIGESTNSSANGKLSIFQSSTSTVESVRITSAASSYTQLYISTTNALFDDTHYGAASVRTASGAFNFYSCSAGGVAQFRVAGNGVIYAQNTSVQSISDIRIKENIVNATDGLEVITALRPVRFDFKEGFGNDLKNQLGFIAQEMETVFPDAVSEWKLNKEDETIYKTVGPAALIPVLVKAIQELNAKVTALENK